jgi:hypothetical protein
MHLGHCLEPLKPPDQRFSHVAGSRSRVFRLSTLNHFAGATTVFPGLRLSHAPHQLNELLAMML